MLSPDEIYSTCKKYLVSCPNGCQHSFPQEEIAVHRDRCPLEQVPCHFQGICCPPSSIQKHLVVIIINAYSQMQKDVEMHDKRLSEAA